MRILPFTTGRRTSIGAVGFFAAWLWGYSVDLHAVAMEVQLNAAMRANGLPCNGIKAGSNAAIYISSHGNDEWSGQLAEPNAGLTDGPVASFEVARNAARNAASHMIV